MNRGAPVALRHSTHPPAADPSFQHWIKRLASPRIRPAGLRRFPAADSLRAALREPWGQNSYWLVCTLWPTPLKSYFVTTS
jgi:hypothetical protein